MFRAFSFFLLIIMIAGCGKSTPTFDNIDLQKWKDDRNACNSQRAEMISALQNQKDKLRGLEEMQIVDLLGRPDQNELFKRNQKFFFYYLQPGELCGNDSIPPLKLSIRFNAMGLAKEVMIE